MTPRQAFKNLGRQIRWLVVALVLRLVFWIMPKDAPIAAQALGRLLKEVGKAI